MVPHEPSDATDPDRPAQPRRYRSRLLQRLMQDADELDAFLALAHDGAPQDDGTRLHGPRTDDGRARDPARDAVLGSFLPVTRKDELDARRPRRR